ILIASCDPAASILYLTGTPRSPDFEAKLEEAGRMVDVRECYRMVPSTYPEATIIDKLTPMPEAILVYSSETARRLGELHDRTSEVLDWPRTRFLCLSEKIADALPTDFRARSRWPMEPREDLLLLLL
ncbi:MAG: uroporphyrinogen-III synthase, partial [Allorhizobium sp.]